MPITQTDLPDTATPPDATEVHDWLQHRRACGSWPGSSLPTRLFDGTARQASGFTVLVEGIQYQTGACQRWVTVQAESVQAESLFPDPLEPEAARQLAAALTAAADEIEARMTDVVRVTDLPSWCE